MFGGSRGAHGQLVRLFAQQGADVASSGDTDHWAAQDVGPVNVPIFGLAFGKEISTLGHDTNVHILELFISYITIATVHNKTSISHTTLGIPHSKTGISQRKEIAHTFVM